MTINIQVLIWLVENPQIQQIIVIKLSFVHSFPLVFRWENHDIFSIQFGLHVPKRLYLIQTQNCVQLIADDSHINITA